MKIRTRITIVCTLTMLFAVSITTALAVHSTIQKGHREAECIRKQELADTKEFLKNFVEAASQTINYDYQSTLDPVSLKKQYGPELKTAVGIVENIIYRKSEKPLTHLDIQTVLNEFNNINANRNIVVYLYKLSNGHIHLSDEEAGISKEQLAYFFKHGQTYSGQYIVFAKLDMPRISFLKFDKKNNLLIGAAFLAQKVISDAKERSCNSLRQFTYANGEGYIFVFDSDCISMVHPHMQYRETTDFSYEKDMSGKRIIAEMVNLCLKNNQGFFNYYWPKPAIHSKMVPDKDKLSYVKLFKPWMWIVGSGAYIEELNKRTEFRKKALMTQADELISSTIQNTLFILLILVVIAIGFSKNLSRPIETLTWTVDHLDIKNLPERIPPLKGPREIVRLGEIFNNMLGSLKDEIAKVRQETSARRLVEGELEVARNIQTDIVHRIFPAFPEGAEFDVHSLYYPASPGSGSFFDMFRINSNTLAVVIGDSTGTGVPASLYSIIARTILRTQSSIEDAGEAITSLNRTLSSNRQTMAECLFLGIIDLCTGNMNYCNAGCSFPFIIRKQRKVEDLPTIHGEPAGIHSGISYSSDNVSIEPYDILLLYSPGLIKIGDIDNPGLSRGEIKKRIERSLNTSGEETLNSIMTAMENSISECRRTHDILVAAFEYLGPI